MKRSMLLACVICVITASIAATRSLARAGGAKEDERAKLIGEWAGNAAIVVNWTKQKSLPLHLKIEAGGKVTGIVGDAKLLEGKFVSNALGSTRFRVHGQLEGNLIDDEQVRRDAVDILFNVADDGSLVGGLHSSGSKFGGKQSMKLSASKMVLRREAADQ